MTGDVSFRRAGPSAAGLALGWFLGSLLLGRSVFVAVLYGLGAAVLCTMVVVAVARFCVWWGRREQR